jgi:hypothetical protein
LAGDVKKLKGGTGEYRLRVVITASCSTSQKTSSSFTL